ncbi:GNAT family N-acetyltransferase [Metabacillus elymi]|uniref:N-acetyltransferase family protein n=1 Tax=Metabacillus elymi TaxID=2745198 RepID=A0ABX6S3U2_9BACI|nr:GNAT family N-acetyltransferase [Metabacillus sp. KUDC1714]QNF28232.1 N-acetyltransferase family protein [Metabacillus sp. KUDC1714]
MTVTIQSMRKEHWDQVMKIYLDGISTGNATFQTEVPTWEDWDTGHIANCRLIATIDNQVVGWTALSPVSGRCVYAGVAEVSVYVNSNDKGKGIGNSLLQALIKASEEDGYWTLQAGIFPENKASLALHKKNGFREVGIRKRIGKINGTWRDVVLLERRSDIQGVS